MNTLGLTRSRWNKEYTAILLTVAIPVTLQNLISIGLNLVDVLMIGRVGVGELAAVGAANRIYSVFGMMCFGLISGFSVYISQYWGVRDIKNIRRVYGLALCSTATLAVLFMLLALIFPRPVLSLFVKEPEVLDLAQQYLRVALFSYPFVAISFTSSFSCRSIRRLTAPTTINALALAANTLLNYGLIFGNWGMPKLGVEGAAIATVIARALELVLLLLYLNLNRDHPLTARLREILDFNRGLVRKVFSTTLPVLINEASITMGMTCFGVIVSFLGAPSVAIMQVSMVINDFFLATFFGVGNAVAVITGNELGRGQTDTAYGNAKVALWLTLGLSILIGLLLAMLRGPIVAIYAFDAETSRLFYDVLLVRALFTPPRMLVYVMICGILRAGGDTRFCMYVDAGSVWLIGVPLSFLAALVWHWQLPGVLAMLFCCDLASCVLCFLRFKRKGWINTLI